MTSDVNAGAPSHLKMAGTPNMEYHRVNSARAVDIADSVLTGTNIVTLLTTSTIVRIDLYPMRVPTSSGNFLWSNSIILSLRLVRIDVPMGAADHKLLRV